MAPEQIEGLAADARTDIFAFGLVLYEMATGRRAFDGKTRASLMAAVLKETPRANRRGRPDDPAGPRPAHPHRPGEGAG
jgi:serine/threonine-protein kinase